MSTVPRFFPVVPRSLGGGCRAWEQQASHRQGPCAGVTQVAEYDVEIQSVSQLADGSTPQRRSQVERGSGFPVSPLQLFPRHSTGFRKHVCPSSWFPRVCWQLFWGCSCTGGRSQPLMGWTAWTGICRQASLGSGAGCCPVADIWSGISPPDSSPGHPCGSSLSPGRESSAIYAGDRLSRVQRPPSMLGLVPLSVR